MTRVTALYSQKPSTTQYPLVGHNIPAGFPSPAEDFIEKSLSLDELLVKHPSATFFVRVAGNSMVGAGILSGDVLVVDRATEACHHSIVVAVVNGEMTVKRLIRKPDGSVELHAENSNYQPILFRSEEALEVWGVVVGVVRSTA